MKKIIILIILLASPLFAISTQKDSVKENNVDGIELNNYYDEEKITYNEGIIVGAQNTNFYSTGIYLEFHAKKQSFGLDLITDGNVAGLELFYKYNFYHKMSYMQGGFYLNGSSFVEFENSNELEFAGSAGMFYSLEVGEDRKWIFEISAGTIVIIQDKKPDPNLRFDLKFGRVF